MAPEAVAPMTTLKAASYRLGSGFAGGAVQSVESDGKKQRKR